MKDMESLRTLTDAELDCVAGAWAGNPGNLMDVGQAGETPNGNGAFITGGTHVDGNGAFGLSSQ
jgi:hypothetical protein